jgi:hypothetical protein
MPSPSSASISLGKALSFFQISLIKYNGGNNKYEDTYYIMMHALKA